MDFFVSAMLKYGAAFRFSVFLVGMLNVFGFFCVGMLLRRVPGVDTSSLLLMLAISVIFVFYLNFLLSLF